MNFSTALSGTGRFARAAAVLNRAQVVALRNGLWRHRDAVLLNLGVVYSKRGQWREATIAWRRLRRLRAKDADRETLLRVHFNLAYAAAQSWRWPAYEAHLGRVRALSAGGCAVELSPIMLRAQAAVFKHDWQEAEAAATALSDALPGSAIPHAYRAIAAHSQGAGGEPRAQQWERACPLEVRLQLLLTRRKSRRREGGWKSMRRVIEVCRRHAATREALQWVAFGVAVHAAQSDEALEYGLETLSRFEHREGSPDVQVELRVHLACALRARNRLTEAWQLYEEALLRFRTLEKRCARCQSVPPMLVHLYRLMRCAMRDVRSADNRGIHHLSEGLCAEAFLSQLTLREGGGIGGRAKDDLLRALGEELAASQDTRATIGRILKLAVERSGAQRALLVTVRQGERTVEGQYGYYGKREEISWAVVSEVLASGRARIYSDALSAEELASHRSIAELRLRSLACIPVKAHDAVLGAMYLDHHGIAGLFCEEDLPALLVLAMAIGVTLQGARDRASVREVTAELEETRRHILRAERNRIVGQIAAGLVHDLKNVLTAVSGRAQLLRQYTEDARVTRSAKPIDQASATAVGLLRRLQECSRGNGASESEVVDVAAVGREAIDLLSPRLQAQAIEVCVRVEGDTLIPGRAGQLRELFLNLVVNACDAMRDGGTLTLSVRRAAEAECVEAEVRDTGCGMAPETIRRAFEPFFTTKGRDGTGLGLVVVQDTLAQHGASIEVESNIGSGTAFKCSFPAAGAHIHTDTKKGHRLHGTP